MISRCGKAPSALTHAERPLCVTKKQGLHLLNNSDNHRSGILSRAASYEPACRDRSLGYGALASHRLGGRATTGHSPRCHPFGTQSCDASPRDAAMRTFEARLQNGTYRVIRNTGQPSLPGRVVFRETLPERRTFEFQRAERRIEARHSRNCRSSRWPGGGGAAPRPGFAAHPRRTRRDQCLFAISAGRGLHRGRRDCSIASPRETLRRGLRQSDLTLGVH